MITEFLLSLIKNFSYLGIFLTSAIGTSAVLIPFPIHDVAIFFTPTLGLHPVLVSIVAGTGAAVGELTGYYIGVGGSTIKTVRKSRVAKFFTKFFNKAGFITVLVAATVLFPFDVVGILAGISKYDVKRFLLAAAIGKTLKALVITYTGYFLLPYVGLLIARF